MSGRSSRVGVAFGTVLALAVLVLGCMAPSCSSGADMGGGGNGGNDHAADNGGAPGDGLSFDAARAMEQLRAQVDFGPRTPGTQGHADCLDYLVDSLSQVTDKTERQESQYTSTNAFPGQSFDMTNVIGTIESSVGTTAPTLLLCAHWDTRPYADQDLDPAKRDQPVLGANDAASGVGVLLELARVFHASRPPVNLVIAFFDGEDFGLSGDLSEWFLGSRYYAAALVDEKPDQAILLDMIGDADLRVEIEHHSLQSNLSLYRAIWDAAKALGYEEQIPSGTNPTASIMDDHLALIQAGIPTVDLIDFDYSAWHTTHDTVDRCSEDSLRAIGETLERVIREGL